MTAGETVASLLLLGVLAAVLAALLLLLRFFWRLLAGPRRPTPRVPPVHPRGDDWDDEEYSARHHR